VANPCVELAVLALGYTPEAPVVAAVAVAVVVAVQGYTPPIMPWR
jgi:hypothetical protein